MRIAVLSDIHGNLTAFEAVMADVAARGPFQLVVANGDHMFGGPRPRETYEELARRGVVMLCGNTERDLGAGEFPPPPMGGRRREKIREIFEWTMATVPATMLKAAAAAPHNLELRIDGGPLLLVAHANALNLDDLIWSDTGEDELERLIGTPSPGLLVVGHIHAPLEMYVGQTHVVRAGSVGLKYERHWFDIAHWADVAWNADSGEWAATARAVTWDFRAEIKAAYAARYPGTDILPGYEDR